jgi:hypothetical protein
MIAASTHGFIAELLQHHMRGKRRFVPFNGGK